jgi:hypothetical protein
VFVVDPHSPATGTNGRGLTRPATIFCTNDGMGVANKGVEALRLTETIKNVEFIYIYIMLYYRILY